jgi:peroxiredoxin
MAPTMNLQSELDLRRTEAGPLYLARIEAAAAELEQAGLLQSCMQKGEAAPDFALMDSDGEFVTLSEVLRSGPAVLSFFRGEWCPFCQAELNALLDAQPELARLGATLVLISPEPPSQGLIADVTRLGARIKLLRDPMLGVALQYGLVYLTPGTLRQFYLERSFDLSRELSTGSWLLPLPADFLIGSDGTVELSWLDTDFTRRLDPKVIIETLERFQTRALHRARTSPRYS